MLAAAMLAVSACSLNAQPNFTLTLLCRQTTITAWPT